MKESEVQEREDLVETLVDVGGAWARYGLGIGRAALETSAMTLTRTAGVLARLADRVDPAQIEGGRREDMVTSGE